MPRLVLAKLSGSRNSGTVLVVLCRGRAGKGREAARLGDGFVGRCALFFVRPPPRRQLLLHAALSLGAAILAVGAGWLLSVPNFGWYASLRRPSFAPPAWLAATSWAVLYGLGAYGLFRVLRRPAWMPDRPAAIRAYGVQMLLGILWAAALYGLRRPVVALAIVAALAIAVLVCGRRFGQVDRLAGWSIAPYAVWTFVAVLANLSVYIRN